MKKIFINAYFKSCSSFLKHFRTFLPHLLDFLSGGLELWRVIECLGRLNRLLLLLLLLLSA